MDDFSPILGSEILNITSYMKYELKKNYTLSRNEKKTIFCRLKNQSQKSDLGHTFLDEILKSENKGKSKSKRKFESKEREREKN